MSDETTTPVADDAVVATPAVTEEETTEAAPAVTEEAPTEEAAA